MLAVSFIGLLFFPCIIIAESKGNPYLTRSHPEETPDRIQSLTICLVVVFLMFVNSIIYLHIGTRQEHTQQLRERAEA